MNMKKWAYLFRTTLYVGGAVMLLTGLSMQLFQRELGNFKGPVDMIINIVQLVFSGFMVSVFAQMGFFAYLTLHNIALGIFKKSWQYIQVLITVFVLLDLMFLRSWLGEERNLLSDVILGLTMLLIAVVVAIYKARATNRLAFTPALFFIIAVTTVEMVFALNVSQVATWFIYIPLIACNAYQMLIIHKLIGGTEPVTLQSSNQVTTAKS